MPRLFRIVLCLVLCAGVTGVAGEALALAAGGDCCADCVEAQCEAPAPDDGESGEDCPPECSACRCSAVAPALVVGAVVTAVAPPGLAPLLRVHSEALEAPPSGGVFRPPRLFS